MKRMAVALLLLAGCGEEARPDPQPSGDEAIFERMRSGALAVDDGLLQVSRSGGWPIATRGGFIFATPDAGLGPYRVASLEDAFPETTLTSEHGVAWARVSIPEPDGKGYRYTTAFGDPVTDEWSRVFRYQTGRAVSVVSAPLPHLERWPMVSGEGLKPRTVRVWVPAETPTHFLYVHGGQNVFNPFATAGGWMLQDAAGPHTLIAAIDNTPDRVDEYTPVQDAISGVPPGGKGDAYAAMLRDVVRPLVEDRYGAPLKLGVMGSSLGGLISLHVGLTQPDAWDLVASLSGTVGWGSIAARERTIIEAYAALPSCPAFEIYVDSGGRPGQDGCFDEDGDGIRDDGGGSDNYCENVQLKETFEALGCGARLHYAWSEGAQHDEAAWRARSPAILALFESL